MDDNSLLSESSGAEEEVFFSYSNDSKTSLSFSWRIANPERAPPVSSPVKVRRVTDSSCLEFQYSNHLRVEDVDDIVKFIHTQASYSDHQLAGIVAWGERCKYKIGIEANASNARSGAFCNAVFQIHHNAELLVQVKRSPLHRFFDALLGILGMLTILGLVFSYDNLRNGLFPMKRGCDLRFDRSSTSRGSIGML